MIDIIAYKTHKASGTLDRYEGDLVGKLVRRRYTLNDELSINRKRDTEPEKFNAFYTYADSCVDTVKQWFAYMEAIIAAGG
jgi:hypothetical protein